MKINSNQTRDTLHPQYRPDIDGLRAIAVLSVLGFHAFPEWFKGGFIGVDIFFVISGFLISTIIFKNLDHHSFSFVDFYARRIKRIFPALLLVLITCLVFGWFYLLADEYKQLGKHTAGGAGFISNYLLWHEVGYFDTDIDTKPLLHLWSLGIEEQFYIIWPFILWFAFKKKLNILFMTLALGLISFGLNIIGVHIDPVATFYSPQTRFWELLSGSMLAWCLIRQNRIYPSPNSIPSNQHSCFRPKTLAADCLSVVAAVFILFGLIFINKYSRFPGWWAILPVAGAMLFILAGPQALFNRLILQNKVLVWFGLISFPLYLWHWPLLSLARVMTGDMLSREFRLILVLFSIVLAWLTFVLIERPIRFGKSSKYTTLICSLLMCCVAIFGLICYSHNGISARAIAQQGHDFDPDTGVNGYKSCDDPLLFDHGVTLNFCLFNPSIPANAALIGDSHAGDKFHGLVTKDHRHHWMLIGNSSCPPVLGINVETDTKGCRQKFENVFNYLLANDKIQTVALSFYGHYADITAYAADHLKNHAGPDMMKLSIDQSNGLPKSEVFYIGLNNAISLLEAHHKKVILFIDVPELPFMPKDCFRNHLKTCQISKLEVLDRQSILRSIISRLQTNHPSLKIFDPVDFVCPNQNCAYKNDEMIIYRDSHHLTRRGSEIFAQHAQDLIP